MKVTKLLALAVVLGMVGVAVAAEGDAPKKERTMGLRGKIKSVDVDAMKLVITQRARGDQEAKDVTVTADKDTKVTLDGQPSSLDKLAIGNFVSITPVEGTAKTIIAYTKMPEHKKPAPK